jgi:hypothetical protein
MKQHPIRAHIECNDDNTITIAFRDEHGRRVTLEMTTRSVAALAAQLTCAACSVDWSSECQLSGSLEVGAPTPAKE